MIHIESKDTPPKKDHASWINLFSAKDRIFLGVLALVVVSLFIIRNNFSLKDGSRIEITVNDRRWGTYNLSEDQKIPIVIDGEEINTVVISEGEAYMLNATCPDRLCIHQGRIRKRGQSIVCLPHKVIVMVTDGEESSIDSMAQ